MTIDLKPGIADPVALGAPFEGGFFAGISLQDGRPYALVVAPKAEGEAVLKWKVRNTSTAGARSVRDGVANSEAMNNKNHPAAQFCRSRTIGGHDDWHLPSRHDAALMAENLMPGAGYVPEQTMAEAFKVGAPEALDRDAYWTSTEFSSGSAWLQTFSYGGQAYYVKSGSFRVRAVRKCPL